MTKLSRSDILKVRKIAKEHGVFILNMANETTPRYPSIYVCVMKHKPSHIIAKDTGFNAEKKTSLTYYNKTGKPIELCKESELNTLEKELENKIGVPFYVTQFRYI